MASAGGLVRLGVGNPAGEELLEVTLNPSGDTYMRSALPDNNYSGVSPLQNAPLNTRTSILEFDLSSLAGKTVVAATLRLYASNVSGPPTVTCYRILAANDWVVTEATQNVRKAGTAWAGSAGCDTAGTDYDNTPVCAGVTPVLATWSEFVFDANGIADLQSQIDGTNRGFVLKATGGGADRGDFDSVEGANPPQLVIQYL